MGVEPYPSPLDTQAHLQHSTCLSFDLNMAFSAIHMPYASPESTIYFSPAGPVILLSLMQQKSMMSHRWWQRSLWNWLLHRMGQLALLPSKTVKLNYYFCESKPSTHHWYWEKPKCLGWCRATRYFFKPYRWCKAARLENHCYKWIGSVSSGLR